MEKNQPFAPIPLLPSVRALRSRKLRRGVKGATLDAYVTLLLRRYRQPATVPHPVTRRIVANMAQVYTRQELREFVVAQLRALRAR